MGSLRRCRTGVELGVIEHVRVVRSARLLARNYLSSVWRGFWNANRILCKLLCYPLTGNRSVWLKFQCVAPCAGQDENNGKAIQTVTHFQDQRRLYSSNSKMSLLLTRPSLLNTYSLFISRFAEGAYQ